MKSLTNFQTTRFANSVRFVFINLRIDYLGLREALSNLVRHKENSSDSDDRSKAAEANSILRTINSWVFCLCLSGCSDIYDLYGKFANACQQVNVLPHERYDKVCGLIGKFSTMMKCIDHADCPITSSNEKKCLWPRYHNDLSVAEEKGEYMGIKIDHINTGNVRQTRLQSSAGELTIADGISLVRERLRTLTWRLNHDLSEDVFDNEVKETIEYIRTICDLKTLLVNIQEKGAVVLGLERSNRFLFAVRKVTNTVSSIADEEITKCYRHFLRKLETFFEGKDIKLLDSVKIIQLILQTDHLFCDVEIIVHCICTAAIKISVESVVESLVSRYEKHFDSSRQMKEENALEEMLIAENGPLLHHADPLLERAMVKYWKTKAKNSESIGTL